MNNQQYLLSYIRDLDIKIDRTLDYNFHIQEISDEDYYKFLTFEEKRLDGEIAIGGIIAYVIVDVFSKDRVNTLAIDFHKILPRNPLGKISSDDYEQFEKSLNSPNAMIEGVYINRK